MRVHVAAFHKILVLTVFVFASVIAAPQTVKAVVLCDYAFWAQNDITMYDPCDTSCSTSTGAPIVTAKNKDYKGEDILNLAQLQAITENKPTYEKAAEQTGVPWQMIAVVHLRETGLKRINPINGDGLYQNTNAKEGQYPAGKVTDESFLEQSVWAGEFLKTKATDASLLASATESEIKNTFWGYNGRSPQYTAQAKTLGFSDGYEGSPYVMNKADALRDPAVNTSTWGQIKYDGGKITYPANQDYGAYVVYASLTGQGSTKCSTGGTLREKVITLAQQELNLWETGTLKPGNDYKKYTYDQAGDWCAWFVSWILKEAGHPVDDTDTPDWPGVLTFLESSQTIGFTVHTGDGYKPKPGDLAIYGGSSHINIVTGYTDGGQMITIGGNQAGDPYTASSVTRSNGYGESATSYVAID